jgi:hypothetical protein
MASLLAHRYMTIYTDLGIDPALQSSEHEFDERNTIEAFIALNIHIISWASE